MILNNPIILNKINVICFYRETCGKNHKSDLFFQECQYGWCKHMVKEALVEYLKQCNVKFNVTELGGKGLLQLFNNVQRSEVGKRGKRGNNDYLALEYATYT